MKAVLVGSVDKNKLYYIMDAQAGDEDGAIVRADGSTVLVNLLSFAAKSRIIKKHRTTRFHRFLWDMPADITSGAWFETFIAKTRPLSKEILNGLNIVSSIGENKQKLKKKNDAALDFLATKSPIQLPMGCCDEMVKSDRDVYSFKSLSARSEAWAAMQLLRHLEDYDVK